MRVITNSFFVGMDIGQASDPSAFAIVERVHTIHDERDPVTWARIESTAFRLRQVQRIPLGTPYPAVVERAREIVTSDALRGNVELVVDSTGVGRAVLDLLRLEDLRGCKVQPVWITGGDKVQEAKGELRVPKRDLVAAVAVELQGGGLQIADKIPDSAALIKELMNFKVEISASGHDTYGAWKEGMHDDLVIAVALAVWRASRPEQHCGLVGQQLGWAL